jgi:hypothetical protein
VVAVELHHAEGEGIVDARVPALLLFLLAMDVGDLQGLLLSE